MEHSTLRFIPTMREKAYSLFTGEVVVYYPADFNLENIKLTGVVLSFLRGKIVGRRDIAVYH